MVKVSLINRFITDLEEGQSKMALGSIYCGHVYWQKNMGLA